MTKISTAADWTRESLMFKRQHTGVLMKTPAPLRPLWPTIAVGLFIMALGFWLMTNAENALIAAAGVAICFAGVALIYSVALKIAATT